MHSILSYGAREMAVSSLVSARQHAIHVLHIYLGLLVLGCIAGLLLTMAAKSPREPRPRRWKKTRRTW